MSSFWNRMTGGGGQAQAVELEDARGQSATVAAVAPSAKPAWGIAQANQLMSTVADTDENEGLVLRVIRTTLESVGVHVGELIAQARGREGELRTEIEGRRSTIAELERQIEAERTAITGLEGELALTRRTREGLERSEAAGRSQPLRPETGPSARPEPRVPAALGGRHSREHDRPTVVAVPPGLGEAVVSDADVKSLPPDEPILGAPKPQIAAEEWPSG